MKLKFFSIAFPIATITFLAAIAAALWLVASSFNQVNHALEQRKVTLALTSELIYGARASHTDPARYSFAHGGKDGTPFPVDRTTYDRTIAVMRDALNAAHLERAEKVRAFRRLAHFTGRAPEEAGLTSRAG